MLPFRERSKGDFVDLAAHRPPPKGWHGLDLQQIFLQLEANSRQLLQEPSIIVHGLYKF